MKRLLRLALFGFLSWLVVFAASVCLYSLKQKGQERLFETLMGLVLTVVTMGFTLLYFRNVQSNFLRDGCLLGLAFIACNLLFDLPMFSAGPMKMPLLTYLREIGLAYLSMPVISMGVGCALESQTPTQSTANRRH